MNNHEQEKIEYIKKSFELKHQKRYKESIEVLYKVLEFENSSEDCVEILSQLGDLYSLLGSFDRAVEQYQKALSLNENHQHSLQQIFEIHFKTNQLNKALKIAISMCENNKNFKNYHNYLRALIALDKKQDAIELFNTLDENFKLDCDILYLISTISEEKKEIILKRILEIDVSYTFANVDMATIEFNRNNFDKVISYCINANDEHPLALYYLARIESDRHNYSRAIELYLKAIELDNDNHDFYFDLAKAYTDVSWLNEAMLALKKSINMSVVKNNTIDIDEKHFLSGWILIKLNQATKALLSLNLIKKDSNLYSKAQVLIQIINLKNSNVAAAITKLEELYLNEKDNLILLDTLALAYKELKLYKKAINMYKQALALNPDSIYYNLELIDLLIDDKNYDESMELINKFQQKYEACPAIYNSLTRIYYRLKDLGKALGSIDEYLKLDINNPESYYFKGLILNDLEKYKQAKDSIYSAIRLNPTIAKYYYQMARSYIGLKEYENALLYSKEAIEINPNEINYKKQAYEISVLIGNEEQIYNFKKQLERSEKILKLKR